MGQVSMREKGLTVNVALMMHVHVVFVNDLY